MSTISDDPRIRNAEAADPPEAFRCECCGAPICVGEKFSDSEFGRHCVDCAEELEAMNPGEDEAYEAVWRYAEEPEPYTPEPDEYEGR